LLGEQQEQFSFETTLSHK